MPSIVDALLDLARQLADDEGDKIHQLVVAQSGTGTPSPSAETETSSQGPKSPLWEQTFVKEPDAMRLCQLLRLAFTGPDGMTVYNSGAPTPYFRSKASKTDRMWQEQVQYVLLTDVGGYVPISDENPLPKLKVVGHAGVYQWDGRGMSRAANPRCLGVLSLVLLRLASMRGGLIVLAGVNGASLPAASILFAVYVGTASAGGRSSRIGEPSSSSAVLMVLGDQETPTLCTRGPHNFLNRAQKPKRFIMSPALWLPLCLEWPR